jgi:putative tryptophan/tyrosine transport system substrate-binding protein
MWRKSAAIIALFVLALLLSPLAADAQQSGKVWRIGILFASGERDLSTQTGLSALRLGLQDRGWTEGRNIAFEIRYVGGRPDRAPALAAELVRSNVDIILTSGTELILAAQKASSAIPVVMVGIGDPVGSGIVASLARPGGHVTGLSLIAPDLAAKRLELAQETLPGLAHVAILWNPNNASVTLRFKETEAAARVMGLKLHSIEARQPRDFEKDLEAAARAGAQALITTEDALMIGQRAEFIRLAIKHRLPAISGLRVFADAGSLLSYGPNNPDLWRRAAGYVDKIFAGARPADLPVEQPTKFELVINLKTAKALGLTIPPSLLMRADEVIE